MNNEMPQNMKITKYLKKIKVYLFCIGSVCLPCFSCELEEDYLEPKNLVPICRKIPESKIPSTYIVTSNETHTKSYPTSKTPEKDRKKKPRTFSFSRSSSESPEDKRKVKKRSSGNLENKFCNLTHKLESTEDDSAIKSLLNDIEETACSKLKCNTI